MRKTIILLLISFCIINFCHAQKQCRIDPELQQILKQKDNELISVNIILKKQIEAEKLGCKRQAFSDKSSKRDAVLKEFKNFSEASQADVLSTLQSGTRSDFVKDIKCHWITNMINCKASADVIYELSQHPDVAAIAYNKKEYMLFNEKAYKAEAVRGMTENITKVNADDVWKQGYTGKGVIVSILDTGINTEHIDLKDHLWDGGSEYPNHGYNTANNSHDVSDDDGHGTHCAGIICGDGTSGTQTGIAPDATLMCIKVLDENGEGSIDAIVSGIEFSVEHGADVLSLSLGASYPDMFTSSIHRNTFTNLLEFDILAAIAAGNDRDKIDIFPIPRNINAPGNCPPAWIHPDQRANAGGTSSVICVGAVDYSDNAAYFSSEGPVTWLGSEWDDYHIDMASDIDPEWLSYDNGLFYTGIGGMDSFSWSVMFPPSKLQNHENGELTKVAMYDCMAHSGDIEIYQGGNTPDKGTLLHTQPYSCVGLNDFAEFYLETPLAIDHTKNLWIVMKSDEGMYGPAPVCGITNDPNGRWIGWESDTGMGWYDMSSLNLNYTWMLRAFVTNYSGEVTALSEDDKFGLIRPDVCAPGVNVISCTHNANNEFVRMSGTSMATPCVAGTIALLLEKYPNLTPAQLCEALETSAVKLTEKKDNRTGSGRIDAMATFNFFGNEEDEEDEEGQDVTTIYHESSYVNIHPNPTNDKLYIETEMEVVEVSVYDVYGRKLSAVGYQQSVVDVAELNSGVYFIKIKTNGKEIIKQFIKQ